MAINEKKEDDLMNKKLHEIVTSYEVRGWKIIRVHNNDGITIRVYAVNGKVERYLGMYEVA